MNAACENARPQPGADLSLRTLYQGPDHACGLPAPSKPALTGNRCQCAACGEYFGCERTFDRHRVGAFGGDRQCLTVAAMQSRGWARNGRGFWLEHRREHAPQRAGSAISGGGATTLPGVAP